MNAPWSSFPSGSPAGQSFDPSISLQDKYELQRGRIYLNGAQALVRLTLLQAQRDRLQGLDTAGFVSGYRGSPLGGVDMAFWSAKEVLTRHQIVFQPGLNEDLAATSVWGSQQVNLFAGAKHQGVFGMWYGKGPGVDRCLDVFKHANAAGTSPHGGVLLVAGDDHAAKSSTLPHQSDHVLKAAMIPVLFPSSLQEFLDLGVLGYAMSRYAGVWVGFKAVADIVECTATVEVAPDRQVIHLPTDFELPVGGLNIRWPDSALDLEARLLDQKLYAALAFCRANGINRIMRDSPHALFGIVASGKAYQDTLQALNDLGLSESVCRDIGIRLYKVGMVWPLEPTGIRDFAMGLREILVVEEKRQFLEYQIKEELYSWREDVRPKVYGKFDERVSDDGREGGEWSLPQGNWLLPAHYELDANIIAKAVARRLSAYALPDMVKAGMARRLAEIEHREQLSKPSHAVVERKPWFCSGCPHNTSTRVPEGSRAVAGIGCHYMAVWMDRNTETYTQMGGEGVPWIGQAPFTRTQHLFANLGDGTYFHSGILAIRASVAAQVNITYKILFNDAVAMTGGQKLDGKLTVPQLTRQLAAEDVSTIVIVSDDPDKHHHTNPQDPMAPGVRIEGRENLDEVQRQLRGTKGVTVLIYEQTCASEKRRRRKRIDPVTGKRQFPDPLKRVVINPRVCEGCGDCSVQSNCLSVEPLETEWGTKRAINQSTCNKDYSCLQGLCPSLVTVEDADLAKPKLRFSTAELQAVVANLPEPAYRINPSELDRRYAILITGVGGTGVVTIGAWLGMAAHLQGLAALNLDMAGLAQKGGAVFSHLQIAPPDVTLNASKIPVGEVDLLLGGDLIVSAHNKTLELLSDQARVVINDDTPPTADFISNPQWCAPVESLHGDLHASLQEPEVHLLSVHAQWVAEHLLGDTVYANSFLLGVAWQKGWIPLHQQALARAIELNAVQVENNLLAFELGRLSVVDFDRFKTLFQTDRQPEGFNLKGSAIETATNTQFSILCADLVRYHSQSYAAAYATQLEALRPLFQKANAEALWLKVARAYHRLLAFKDEYEVANLHVNSEFMQATLGQFQTGATVHFHFAPPWLKSGSTSSANAEHVVKFMPKGSANAPPSDLRMRSRPLKHKFGPNWQPALRLLASLKRIRGTWLDPFRNSPERIAQQELIRLFESWLRMLHNDPSLIRDGHQCNEVIQLFNQVKGYGQVRIRSYESVIETLRARCISNGI